MHASGLTELVGREEELELLLRRWSKAKTGEGQVVLLSGEAGIGKSRLTAALLERLADRATHAPCATSAHHSTPTARSIRSSARWSVPLDLRTTTPRKQGSTNSTPCWRLALRHVRTPRSLPKCCRCRTMDAIPVSNLAPQQRRQKTLEALTAQLEALSRSNPVLMIFEDVHWIDPTSLEALGRTVDRIRSLGVLLIVTYRPEFEPPWIGRPHVTTLTLNGSENAKSRQ